MIKLFKDKSKCNDISLSIICTIWVPAGRDVFIETVDKRQLHADAHVAVCCAWIQDNGILCTILCNGNLFLKISRKLKLSNDYIYR